MVPTTIVVIVPVIVPVRMTVVVIMAAVAVAAVLLLVPLLVVAAGAHDEQYTQSSPSTRRFHFSLVRVSSRTQFLSLFPPRSRRPTKQTQRVVRPCVVSLLVRYVSWPTSLVRSFLGADECPPCKLRGLTS